MSAYLQERRALVASLTHGDVVMIGRDADRRPLYEGTVVARAHKGVVKVAVGDSVIPFHPTGLERAAAALGGVGHGRGLRVLVGRR